MIRNRLLPYLACMSGLMFSGISDHAVGQVPLGQRQPARSSVRSGLSGLKQMVPSIGNSMHQDQQVAQASCISCGDAGCADCGAVMMDSGCYDPCSRRTWGNIEYLMWWQEDARFPSLVTTSPDGTARDDAGVLGSSTALFGGTIDSGTHNGARLTLGMDWPGGASGIGATLFALGEETSEFRGSSDTIPILGRPFFNTALNEEDALLLGFPNELSGSVDALYSTETMGTEVFLRSLYRQQCNYRLDFIYGYRYLGHDETLRINNQLTFIDPAANTVGTEISQRDLFGIENVFHGGELGIMGHSVDGCWSLDFVAKIALGNMNRMVNIDGSTTTTSGSGLASTVNGGLLTQNSNMGKFETDEFTVVPEFTLTLGYALNHCLDFTVGYTLLYVDNVIRADSVIDRQVNLTQQTGTLIGEARPAANFTETDLLLQGLNLGLNLKF